MRKIQRYSQELSEYTFRQFCLATALLEIKDTAAMPYLSPAHRRLACQVNQHLTDFSAELEEVALEVAT